ncbi:MAG: AAA family ATPase, partial [Gemmatimonadota bacterium]|nr:AAA family ATPase [Gemmatimonadota bacterium]
MSVLFVDLVGFTAVSERRDSEEVRELLTRYFDAARETVGQYGGVVEKFIGDAVMAVWGTPVAHENDAERAVRAALEIVAAVPSLDPGLQARAGVVTGEVAATLDAVGQGMVAGDAVNTASRVQSAAAPGEVLVDEATWRLTESGLAYAEAGEHVVKGKAQPLTLHRALRVVANLGGGERSATLEAAFVGRDREMRLVKDLFSAVLGEGRARLVAVTGTAGMGKSRLAWEFEKYVDGIAVEVLWHDGRAVKYGEGVAYWALAEVVRGRFEVTEQEPAATVVAKIAAGLERYVADGDERAWLLPRLAHLLGVGEEGIGYPREDLFPAWRLLLERLSQTLPVVMVLEDVEQADAGLLDFLDYLMEWSAEFPIFVLALARPELAEHRPRWDRGGSTTTPIYLEPLPGAAMSELVESLVPGLPGELRGRLVEHAEGVPLYAVEIVRMLLDRDVLIRTGMGYQLTRPLDRLDVPVSLQALIGARLDALSSEERRLVQDASVLGTTFHRTGVQALTGLGPAELDGLLAGLLRKEVLRVRSDPLSPERGQYAFVQGLMRTVAYDRFSKRERKSRHVLVAEYLERAWAGGAEIAEVVASHYFEAFTAAPGDADAEQIRHKALDTLAQAGDRAASLAAPGEARRWYERVADLCDDAAGRAGFLERAGEMAMQDDESTLAIAHFEAALAARDVSSDPSVGRTLALLGEAQINSG